MFGKWGTMSLEVLSEVSLKELTWWKIGGAAEHFATPRTLEDLKSLLVLAHKNSWPVVPLGGGSNVLISDEGIKGLVIHMKELKKIDHEIRDQKIFIKTLAGTPKSELLKIFLKNKLSPALFLCGLPGDVGGGVVMNAGVSELMEPREFNELVDAVTVLRIENSECVLRRFEKSEIQWSYRKSLGWKPGVIAEVEISWPMTPDLSVMGRVKEATRVRLSKQPLEFPSCGSVFKNPPRQSAGSLIEKAGLKGFKIGEVEVSEKHANFIVNKKSLAKAKDARLLIEHIQSVVLQKFGIELQPEVQFLGRF